MLWLGIILLIIIVILIMSGRKDYQIRENSIKNAGIIYYNDNVNYIGGFKDIVGGKKVSGLFLKEKLINVSFFDENTLSNIDKFITQDQFLSCEIMSKESIEKEVSLGKLLCFGILAFGMKNNKSIIDNYLVIKYQDLNETRSVIFKCNNNLEETVRKINENMR